MAIQLNFKDKKNQSGVYWSITKIIQDLLRGSTNITMSIYKDATSYSGAFDPMEQKYYNLTGVMSVAQSEAALLQLPEFSQAQQIPDATPPTFTSVGALGASQQANKGP